MKKYAVHWTSYGDFFGGCIHVSANSWDEARVKAMVAADQKGDFLVVAIEEEK